ncbi:hypothetical protein FOZ61_006116 [Perkinsus olseni]|uniref:START domain-containing protein n=1 Tax=Perkinsus olseni TaxID=32597 RepID=A0A7J6LS43_PEROL|nr:hypothetical protein FOZ61_006116 [Perkinsus olseni]KAF4662057.1 hypothetical protein FOL46_005488 [Perkinsus olseni]
MSLRDLGQWCSETFANDNQLEFAAIPPASRRSPPPAPEGSKIPIRTAEKVPPELTSRPVEVSGLLLQITVISSIAVVVSSIVSALLSRYGWEILELLASLDRLVEIGLFFCGISLFRAGLLWMAALALVFVTYWKAWATVASSSPVEHSIERRPRRPTDAATGLPDDVPQGSTLIEKVSEVLALPDASEADPDGFQVVHTQTEPCYLYVEKRSVMVSDAEAEQKAMSQWRITVHIRNHSAKEVYDVMVGRKENEWNSQCTGSEVIAVDELLEKRSLELVRCTYAGVPLTISAREVLQLRACQRAKQRSILAFTSDGTNAFNVPVKEGHTRAHQHLGGWLIQPLSDNTDGTLLKIISCVDPGGYVPVSVLNWMGWRGAVELCMSLSNFLENNRT